MSSESRRLAQARGSRGRCGLRRRSAAAPGGAIATALAVAILSGEPVAARGEPSRVFTTEIACAKDRAFGAATCRRAFQVARATYETATRSYPNRFGCYRAYGPCMPWPASAGASARFRPQWMGVSLTGSTDAVAAAPVVAPGRVRLALAPRALSAALPEPPEAPVLMAGPRGEATAALCRHIEAVAEKEHLPPGFLARLLWQESSFRAHVVSPAGALGIAQFMPGTAQERGLADPFDPVEAIRSSAALLGDLARQFGNLGLAAAAYNGGPARVSGWLQGRRTLAPETEAYVLRITGRTVREWTAGSPIRTIPSAACSDLAARIVGVAPSGSGPPETPHPSIGSPSPTIPLASSASAR